MAVLAALRRWVLLAARGAVVVLLVIVPVPIATLFFRGKRDAKRPVAAQVLKGDER